MMKINAMGITGDVFDWIEDWLNDREQIEMAKKLKDYI